jgi:hypothetical protein
MLLQRVQGTKKSGTTELSFLRREIRAMAPLNNANQHALIFFRATFSGLNLSHSCLSSMNK